jgi:hypothetical protein
VGTNLTATNCGYKARHFLIPWTGGAFAPLGPFLCPTTEEKNGLLPQSRGPRTCMYWVNEFNIKKKFKKQNLLASILKLECLACNLLQISQLKLCFEKRRFCKKCILRMQKMLFQRPKFLGGGGGGGACPQIPLANSCLRYSGSHLRQSHTIPGGGQVKWALWQFYSTTEESLKNALL